MSWASVSAHFVTLVAIGSGIQIVYAARGLLLFLLCLGSCAHQSVFF